MATATKENKKTARASGDSEPLPGMEDEFHMPAELEEAAAEYKEAQTEKNQSASRFKTAKEVLIEQMRDQGVERVRIELESGEKWVVLEDEYKLTLKPVKRDGGGEEE